jgi:glycosidase
VFDAFATEERMRIYGKGIRRRAGPMLGGDSPRLRMAWSLTFSLPGTPVLLYGDEIGMEDDLSRDGRMSVRLPMDWGEVAAQRRDPDSLLNFVSKLVHARRSAPEFGWGQSTLLENESEALFARRCDWQGSTVFALHNLSEAPIEATLELGDDVTGVEDLLELRRHVVQRGRLEVDLGAYGSLWLRAR